MRANIDMTHGLVMSEAVMMGLGPHLDREALATLCDPVNCLGQSGVMMVDRVLAKR